MNAGEKKVSYSNIKDSLFKKRESKQQTQSKKNSPIQIRDQLPSYQSEGVKNRLHGLRYDSLYDKKFVDQSVEEYQSQF